MDSVAPLPILSINLHDFMRCKYEYLKMWTQNKMFKIFGGLGQPFKINEVILFKSIENFGNDHIQIQKNIRWICTLIGICFSAKTGKCDYHHYFQQYECCVLSFKKNKIFNRHIYWWLKGIRVVPSKSNSTELIAPFLRNYYANYFSKLRNSDYFESHQ